MGTAALGWSTFVGSTTAGAAMNAGFGPANPGGGAVKANAPADGTGESD